MKQTDQYTVRLDLTEDERRDLRVLAARRGVTISAAVTELVKRYLAEINSLAPIARESL